VSESVVDVWDGDGEALSGNIRQTLEAQDPGLVRYAFDPQGDDTTSISVSLNADAEIVSATATMYGADADRTLSAEIVTASEADAANLEGLIEQFKTQLSTAAERGDSSFLSPEDATAIEDGLSYETSGPTLSIDLEMSRERLTKLVTGLSVQSFFIGLGDTDSEVPPTAAFNFDYETVDDSTGKLTIAHDAGDAIPAEELYIRGEGFADISDVDQTESGPWQGETDDEGRVTAGHRTVVGARTDYEISVVWSTGDNSTTLAEDSGPDA
jgi:hypothetical protein